MPSTLLPDPTDDATGWGGWLRRLSSYFRADNDPNIRHLGGVGNGVADDTAFFIEAEQICRDAVVTLPNSLASDKRGQRKVKVPRGVWNITSLEALLGSGSVTQKASGLVYEGEGSDITIIILNAASAGNLMKNTYWQNVEFRNISFYSNTPGSTLFYGAGTQSMQRMVFWHCDFYRWKHGIYLEGTNNNSEFYFFGCRNYQMEKGGAFIRIPTTGSDQFLNYHWYGGAHWVTSAPFVWAEKGGHFKIVGLDASAFGNDANDVDADNVYLFRLLGTSHALGVCDFQADNIRVEAKAAAAKLLDSEWPQGNVTLDHVDWSSQTGTYTYGNIIRLRFVNFTGPRYKITNSSLAGKMEVQYNSNDFQYPKSIQFEDTEFRQNERPSDFVVYTAQGVNALATPPVNFERCNKAGRNDPVADNGSLWDDVTVGWRGASLSALREKSVMLRTIGGVSSSAQPKTFLPKDALITGISVTVPANTTAEANGAEYTLWTNDTTPVSIAQVAVTGSLAAGVAAQRTTIVPFKCDTDARALVKLIVTNQATAAMNEMIVRAHGHW